MPGRTFPDGVSKSELTSGVGSCSGPILVLLPLAAVVDPASYAVYAKAREMMTRFTDVVGRLFELLIAGVESSHREFWRVPFAAVFPT